MGKSTIVKRVTIYLGWNLIDPQIISFFCNEKEDKETEGNVWVLTIS